MKKIILTWLALCAALFGGWQLQTLGVPHFKSLHVERLLVSPAQAQMPLLGFPPGAFDNLAARAPRPTYQGPGDLGISSATLLSFWSCGRVAKALLASTSTSLCDLDQTGTATPVGTLRASSSGYVDLSAYFSGSVTPLSACTTAGGCSVAKYYDQIGSFPATQATAADMPRLLFSALNNYPCMNNPTNGIMRVETANITQTLPMVLAGVAERTTNNGIVSRIMNASGTSPSIGWTVTTNQLSTSAGTTLSHTATGYDGAFHAVIGDLDVNANADSALVVEGSSVVTGASGSGAFGGSTGMGFMSDGGGSSLEGTICENSFWSGFMNSTDYGKLNTNMHGSSGWNF